MTRTCASLVALALVTACGGAPEGRPAPSASTSTTAATTGATRSLAARAADLRAEAARSDLGPGLVVLLEQGGASETIVTGVASRDPERPLKANDTVMVASVTKLMVAICVMRLVESGRLALTDTVEKVVPGLLPDGARITLEQLLSMTSGLPGYDGEAAYPGPGKLPAKALVDLVKDAPRSFAPGLTGEESNTNYAVLGLVVEKLTGRPLADTIRAEVVAKAGLTATTLGGTPTATGYDAVGNDVTVRAPKHPSAAAGAVSSVPDVGRLIDALLAGRLLSAATVEEMERSRTVIEDVHHGLGLRSIDLPCGTAYGMPGGNDGYAVRAWRLPDLDRTVVGAVTSGTEEAELDVLVTAALCD